MAARADEMAASGWDEAEIEAFLIQQFQYQHQYYQAHYADGQFLVVCKQEQAIGRLYWWADGDQASLIDISLLPEYRGAGIGSALLARMLARADADGQAISLHVEPYNPAYRLYCRNGFDVIGQNGVYLKMRRPPQGGLP